MTNNHQATIMKYTLYLIRRLVRVLALAGLLPMLPAQADYVRDYCTRSDGKPAGSLISIPIPINIGRDVQEGEAYGPWFQHTLTWTCTRTAVPPTSSFQPANDHFHVKTDFYTAGVLDKGLFAADPSFRVYGYRGTNIGLIAKITQHIGGQPPQTSPLNALVGVLTTKEFKDSHARLIGDVTEFHITLHVRLVKLKGTTVKTSNFRAIRVNFFSAKYYADMIPHWVHHANYPYFLKPDIDDVKAACATPDVPVRLDTAYTSYLQTPDGAGPAKDFTLRFEKCPPYLTAIDYALHAVPRQTITNGILPLVDQPNSATGVGVQVLMPDGITPLAFDTPMSLGAYDPNRPNATYEIPLKVRVARTSGALEAGQVKALMEMEVTYK